MKKIAVLALLVLSLVGSAVSGGADPLAAPWIWSVAVVPPPGGWLAEQGVAVRAGLLLLQGRLNEPAEGVRGFDVIFSWDDALLPDAVPDRVEAWRARGVVAVLSFASPETDRALALAMGRQGPPLLFAGGEDFSLKDLSGSPLPYLFALSQEKTCRANALSDYVLRQGGPVVALLSDLLEPDLLRGHDEARHRLEARGMPTLSLLFRTSADDALLSRVDEVLAARATSALLFLDPLATLDLWALTRRMGYSLSLLYGGPFGPPLGTAEGLLFADQDYPLATDPQLEHLRDDLWLDEGLRVADGAAAARAYSLGLWLAKALEAAGPEASALAEALGHVESIALGSQLLSIDSRTHRPLLSVLAVLEVGPGGRLIEKAFVDVRSFEVSDGRLEMP